jgi:hypothetical protein
MIKGVTVTFNFDTETSVVTDVKCSVDGMVKKTRATTKKSDVVEEMASESIITLEDNKLCFNNKAVSDMELVYEDRIVIKFEPEGPKKNKILVPTIGKDTSFDEPGAGNKLTKTNSIGYKGKQNAVLAEFGTEFTLEPFKEGIWKLISKNGVERTLQENIEIVEKEEPIVIIDADETVQIDEFAFNL